MREIKIKGWSKKFGMSQPMSLRDIVNAPHGTDLDEYDLFLQSTGLFDKNGVEIWEGDILRQLGLNIEVKYKYHIGVTGEDSCFIGFEIYPTDEVIGNIFENPELLTPTKE